MDNTAMDCSNKHIIEEILSMKEKSRMNKSKKRKYLKWLEREDDDGKKRRRTDGLNTVG